MTVKIGNQEEKEVVKESKSEIPTTLKEKLALAKQHLEAKYGEVAVFKLPNGKRTFFRAPNAVEYQIYTEKTERLMWNQNKKNPVVTDSLVDIRAELVKACLIQADDNTVIGNLSDLDKFPAAYPRIADRLEIMVGSEVEEDFLD
jgi:hypothetical protein